MAQENEEQHREKMIRRKEAFDRLAKDDPASYLRIMSSFVPREQSREDFGDLTDEEIKRITAKVSFVGISSDWLFPASDILNLAEKMKSLDVDAEYFEIISDDGHDAFLSDIAATSRVLREILGVKEPKVQEHFFPKIKTEPEAVGCYK